MKSANIIIAPILKNVNNSQIKGQILPQEKHLSFLRHEFIEKIVIHAPDKSSGHRTQQIEIYYRFDVAVSTAVADSIKYDKKRKAA